MWPFLVAAAAFAQQDAALCKGGFSNDDLRVRVESAGNAMATTEVEVARRLLKKTQDQLTCLETVVARPALADLAWLQAFVAYLEQDESRAVRWARLARVVVPDAPLPGWVPPGHPFVDLVDEQVSAPSTVGEGRPLAPRGGALFLDGAFLPAIRGYSDTPGFWQVTDDVGRVVASGWLEGAAFPEEYVGEPGPDAKPPRWWTGEPASGPPPAPRSGGGGVAVGRVLAAGGLALVAGGAYGAAAVSTGALSSAPDEAALAGARTRVNVLAVGSVVLAAGALGVGVTAWLDDGGGVGLVGRF